VPLTLGDDYWMLSTVEWPNCYMYLSNQNDYNAKGWSADPGPQGYFKFHANHDATYLISTK